MVCKCSDFADWVTSDDSIEPFSSMLFIRSIPDQWMTVRQCIECKQIWAISAFEKYCEGLCVKVDDYDGDFKIDTKKYFLDRLVKNYGGTSSKDCIYQDCHNKSLENLAYCPACALEKNKIYS